MVNYKIIFFIITPFDYAQCATNFMNFINFTNFLLHSITQAADGVPVALIDRTPVNSSEIVEQVTSPCIRAVLCSRPPGTAIADIAERTNRTAAASRKSRETA